MGSQTILVATLGGQPQVVTFALDALLAQGEVVQAVYVLHPALLKQRLQQSLDCLKQAFAQRYAGQPCTLQRVALMRNGRPLVVIRDAAEAAATLQTIYHLLASLKNEGQTALVDCRRSAADGPVGTSAAMLLLNNARENLARSS